MVFSFFCLLFFVISEVWMSAHGEEDIEWLW
jgi:hypothetical protein